MTANEILRNGLDKLFSVGGLSTTIDIYNYTFDSNSYDDNITKILTGSITTSGLIFPIKGKQGSEEALLMEQGKITTQDKILYTGSLNLTGSGNLVEIDGNNYTIIPDGVKSWDLGNDNIYNKIYLRYSQTGSLF